MIPTETYLIFTKTYIIVILTQTCMIFAKTYIIPEASQK